MTTKSLRVIRALSVSSILLLTAAFSSAYGAQTGSTLTATYLGVGADVVGTYSFTPDGIPDFRISLGGLRSTPDPNPGSRHGYLRWCLEHAL